ncbi:MAG: hypothetical protein HZB32_07245 [Nitrospirae bacterium]|nr:hypothetical protein [Nitrospirota bacterium]
MIQSLTGSLYFPNHRLASNMKNCSRGKEIFRYRFKYNSVKFGISYDTGWRL